MLSYSRILYSHSSEYEDAQQSWTNTRNFRLLMFQRTQYSLVFVWGDQQCMCVRVCGPWPRTLSSLFDTCLLQHFETAGIASVVLRDTPTDQAFSVISDTCYRRCVCWAADKLECNVFASFRSRRRRLVSACS